MSAALWALLTVSVAVWALLTGLGVWLTGTLYASGADRGGVLLFALFTAWLAVMLLGVLRTALREARQR